jgi:hypothetical protein
MYPKPEDESINEGWTCIPLFIDPMPEMLADSG